MSTNIDNNFIEGDEKGGETNYKNTLFDDDCPKESEDTFEKNQPPPLPPRPGLSNSKVSFRPKSTQNNQSLLSFIKIKISHALILCKFTNNNNNNENIDGAYKVHSLAKKKNNLNVLSCVERTILRFSDWVYRAPFIHLLLSCTFLYFALVLFYSFLLLFVAWRIHVKHDHSCITSLDFDEHSRQNKFEYTFDLSWTTFSTVGYGLFSPEQEPQCWGIRIICAIEAFTGILFASCSGAFLFSKINRIQFSAPVTFSRIMCLQYGEGLLDSDITSALGAYLKTSMKSNDNYLQEEDDGSLSLHHFPFIEFRIVHNDCNKRKRAIVDASLSCYVILPTDTSSILDKDYLVPNFRHSASYKDEEPVGYKEKIHFPGKVFHQLKIDNDKLPFYDKVWYVRHTLDESSPLLTDNAKILINKNGGDHWPDQLNNYKSIQESIIDFQLITVQLKGMSQVTASPVYAEMEYNFKDIYIGWQFTGLLYRFKDIYRKYKIVVDTSLIHDIAPQRGGRHEPIHDGD